MNRRTARNLRTGLLVAGAGLALATLWALKRQAVAADAPTAADDETPVVARTMPPSDSRLDEPELTAVPHVSHHRGGGPDDYESISPEDLSAAFLGRATDSWGEVDPSDESEAEAELHGFQVATIDSLAVPELSDDPADFEIPSVDSSKG